MGVELSFPTSESFSRHSENLAEITASLVQIERAHKRAIREGDVAAVKTLRRLHYLLVGVFAEARLRKIIDDPTGFNERERRLIWAAGSQEDRWSAAVDFAARRHYRVLAHEDLASVVPHQDMGRLNLVQELLSSDLRSTITDRNRLAHGQWRWQLKSRRDDVFVASSTPIDFNYVAIKARSDLISAIGELVGVLAVSKPTFDRDFTALHARISRYQADLAGGRYATFEAELRARRPRP